MSGLLSLFPYLFVSLSPSPALSTSLSHYHTPIYALRHSTDITDAASWTSSGFSSEQEDDHITGFDHLLNSDQRLTRAWTASSGGPAACSGHGSPVITSSRLPFFAGLHARSAAQDFTGGVSGGTGGGYVDEVRSREFE